MVLNAIIMGPPASGKGSVCASVKENYTLTHISTGDLLRAKTNEDTDSARELADVMKNGGLVKDEVVIGLVKETVDKDSNCKANGYLLDGFPRTEDQARIMFAGTDAATSVAPPDVLVVLKVGLDTLKERITHRRLDPQTGTIYNLKTDKDIPEDVKARLVQRNDDTEETVVRRFETYCAQEAAITSVFKSTTKCAVIEVSAEQPLEAVRKQVDDGIKAAIAAALAAGVVAAATDADGKKDDKPEDEAKKERKPCCAVQ